MWRLLFYLACLRNENIPLILNESTSNNYIEQYIKALKPSAILSKKLTTFLLRTY